MRQPNRFKDPSEWSEDVARSVNEYAEWYLRQAPIMWAAARKRAIEDAEQAMKALDDLREVTAARLKAKPQALAVLRMAISPKMARDRFVEFVGVRKSLVEKMERKGIIPVRAKEVDADLGRICEFVVPLLDPRLFPWLSDSRSPTSRERKEALLVLGDRRAGAIYDADLRNVQEAKQRALMRDFLESHGFEESLEPAFKMPPETFGFGRNVSMVLKNGRKRNLPCDCVVVPVDSSLPLACVEMKSAGDYTNVNKRRKEEAEKHDALQRAYGDDVVFLLQLCGYFNDGYLEFEADAGIDWAWDHRLEDLAPHFGIEL